MGWRLKPINPINRIIGKPIKIDIFSKEYNEFLSFPEDFMRVKRKHKKDETPEETEEKKEYIWVPRPRDDSKPAAKLSDVENIVGSSFLTEEEKTAQLQNIGATNSIIQIAKMKLKQKRRKSIGGGQWR